MTSKTLSCYAPSANPDPMKIKLHFAGFGIVTLASLAGEMRAESVVFKESLTQEQLILARRQADGENPTKHLTAATGEDPSVVNRPKSLLGDSDFICYGRYAALVPKRAILQTPKNFAERLKMQPGVILQSWSEFYAANRGWITTVEVSRTQAEGNDPIAEEVKLQMSKNSNLIVATYLGGPISVLPLKVPVEKTPTQTKP
jgi:hypothetical protein